MPELVAVDRTGADFLATMLDVWASGDAVLPIDPRLPEPARDALLDAMRPSSVIDAHGEVHRRPDGIGVEPGDALVIATSGSTGAPKGVVHTHDSMRASARITSSALGTRADDRWLCCLPTSHIAGIAVIVRALEFELPLVMHDRFDADDVERAAREGATLTSLVPTALSRIDPTLFRTILVGGAAAPDGLPANCRATYGMTETASAVVLDGEVLDGVELRVRDSIVEVRGPMLLRCYRDGTDPRTSDGWFATGDAGELSDGRLVVHGRVGDVIVTGGEKVWPAPIEALLAALPSIAEVAVIGRPDPEWGSEVTAIVVPRDGHEPTLEQLREHVRASLPAYCAPRRLELVAALPRTSLGKVRRREL